MGIPVSISQVCRGVVPFVGVALLLLVLLIFFPDIALWLPGAAQT